MHVGLGGGSIGRSNHPSRDASKFSDFYFVLGIVCRGPLTRDVRGLLTTGYFVNSVVVVVSFHGGLRHVCGCRWRSCGGQRKIFVFCFEICNFVRHSSSSMLNNLRAIFVYIDG